MEEGTQSSRSFTPIQLRLGFSTPSAPVRMIISLQGLYVYVDSAERDLAVAYLTAVGAKIEISQAGETRFHIRDLTNLKDLPEQVSIHATGNLGSLWTLAAHPPEQETVVSVSADTVLSLNLSWVSGKRRFDEPLAQPAIPAFVALSIPFSATSEVWDSLLGSTGMPVRVGTAKVNHDRYIEITTVTPQKIIASPMPALFRIDGSHFGIPLAHSDCIASTPGFAWEGLPPAPDNPPHKLRVPPVELSDHANADLRDFVDGLSNNGARLVAWKSGLGRRVFCLAAIDSLSAYPTLVVTHPHALFSWIRNTELMSRTWSIGESSADTPSDVIILTYEMLPDAKIYSPAAIVFDDLDIAIKADAAVPLPLRRFDGLMDVPRVGLMQELPQGPQQVTDIMSVLRPGEFREGLSISARYPGDARARYSAHLAVYASIRMEGDTKRFTKSLIEPLTMPIALRHEQSKLIARMNRSKEDILRELRTLSSAGTESVLSPKIAKASEMVRVAVRADRRVVVLTNQERTEAMLRAVLRPIKVGNPGSQSQVIIARFDMIPLISTGLDSYDEVIVVDIPRSFNDLNIAVGEGLLGPSTVTVLHMVGGVDDAFAVLAAKRANTGVVGTDPLSFAEVDEVFAALETQQQ